MDKLFQALGALTLFGTLVVLIYLAMSIPTLWALGIEGAVLITTGIVVVGAGVTVGARLLDQY